MSNFKSRGRFGGGRGGGFKQERFGRGGQRGDFSGGRRDFAGPREMFSAKCTNCGKTCEVPFRPTGDRPVYCNDCFSKSKGESQRTFDHSRDDRRAQLRPQSTGDIEGLTYQVKMLGTKIDALAELVKSLAPARPTQREEVRSAVEAALKPAKKTAKGRAKK